jgi:hypothetical protein
VGIAAVGALLVSTVLPTYAVLAVAGDTVIVQPDAVRRRLEWHKPKNQPGRWVPHYEIRAVATVDGNPVALHDECGLALYTCVKDGSCGSVPWVVARHAPETFHEVGWTPMVSAGRAAFSLFALAALAVVYASSAASRRPWYRRVRVVDTEEGRLG